MTRLRRMSGMLSRFCAVFVLSLLVATTSQGNQAAPALKGTFIQLNGENAQWTRQRWEALFQRLSALRVDQVFVQWVAFDDQAFYPRPRNDSPGANALSLILDVAEQSKMAVWVGLKMDSKYWQAISRKPYLVEVYLRRRMTEFVQIEESLVAAVKGKHAFAGWYIPDEIDDQTWFNDDAQLVLFAYLKDLSARLRTLLPGMPVAISGFSNGKMEPQRYALFWRRLLQETGIDVLLFQDGVGAGKLTVADVSIYLQPLRTALDQLGLRLYVVVELFSQVSGPPVSDGPFAAVPASLQRISAQLSAVQPYAGTIIGFSIPDYMDLSSGPAADALYKEYHMRVVNK